MAEQNQNDPLDYSSRRFERIKKEALDAIRGTADVEKGWEKAQEAAEEYYKQMKQQKALVAQLGKEYEEVFKKAEDKANKFVKPIEKITSLFKKFPIDRFFDQDKIDSALTTLKTDMITTFEQSGGGFGESITSGITEGLVQSGKAMSALSGFAFRILGALSGWKLILGIGGAVLLGLHKLWDTFKAVDEAASKVVKTTGILDNNISDILITATESSAILGGNLEFASDAIEQITSQFSVSIPLSTALVSNVAILAEKFGLGVETTTKLTRIISERLGTGLERSSMLAGDFIDSLGRIGPAVVRNIVENYEAVNNKFGLSINQLREQGFLATQLGISLADAVSVSEGLLSISSSITSQFKASALLGQELNLNRARQLAFSGDIVGANQEILNQVEKIGDLSKLNFFQRQALAEATGKTVSELERELNIRRRLGRLGQVQQRTRETALGRIEQLTRSISAQFFRVFASQQVQDAFESFAESITNFITSDRMDSFIKILSNFVDALGSLISGEASINPWGLFGIGDFYQRNTNPNAVSFNDGIITDRGEIVSTNPRDYIIATQNPAELVANEGNQNNEMVREMVGLLKDLKSNGVKATLIVDGRKMNKQLANAGR